MSADPLLAYGAFLIGVASPGPSVLASGIVSGSLFRGLCAAFGLAALMQRYTAALLLVKIVGGLYLSWMAWQAACKAIRGMRASAGADAHTAPG